MSFTSVLVFCIFSIHNPGIIAEKSAKSMGINTSRSWMPQVNLHLLYQTEPKTFFISHDPSSNNFFCYRSWTPWKGKEGNWSSDLMNNYLTGIRKVTKWYEMLFCWKFFYQFSTDSTPKFVLPWCFLSYCFRVPQWQLLSLSY